MKGHNLWSYAPYKPLLRNIGDIYICRIAPGENAIHFEWLDIGEAEYSIFYRKRNDDDFILSIMEGYITHWNGVHGQIRSIATPRWLCLAR